jgi:SAM-dependent methyltransferase
MHDHARQDCRVAHAQEWLVAAWPLVLGRLPAAPACVVDLGCGQFGGFVPMLRAAGYDALGIDPDAPDGEHYVRVEFERAALPAELDAIVASTSLHHVSDPAHVLNRIAGGLRRGGVAVVLEWAWERLDRATAEWSFERLPPGADSGWLHRRRQEWLASGDEWENYLRGWAEHERLHRSDLLVRLLDERLERRLLAEGPYLFTELENTTAADEQAAIDAGRISPTRVDYVGVRV